MKVYELAGYLKISEESHEGFLIPVLQCNNKKYSLEIDNDIISGINELEDFYEDYICYDIKDDYSFKSPIKEGGGAFFIYQTGDLLFRGTKDELIDQLTSNFKEYINNLDSFNKYELFSFLGISGQAEIEKQKIKSEENISIAEEQLVNLTLDEVNLMVTVPKSIIAKDSYHHFFKMYSNLKYVFSNYNLKIRIGNNLINKEDLNAYLESENVRNSLTSRYSVEAYIFIKKQCNGDISGIKNIPILNKENLEVSPRIPCLYKNLQESWELSQEEIPVINKLDSNLDDDDELTSPSILNMKFEARLFINHKSEDRKVGINSSIKDLTELDSIMKTIIKINR